MLSSGSVKGRWTHVGGRCGRLGRISFQKRRFFILLLFLKYEIEK